jgi:hypothetical protein
MANADKDLDNDLDGLLVPWHWDCIEVKKNNSKFIDWCENLDLEFGLDYYYAMTDKTIAQTSEWGQFKLGSGRGHYYLFKDGKYATMFRLRWSEYIA